MDRILRPNMDLHAEGFGRTFVPAGSGENRSFFTRLFGGSHGADARAVGTGFRSSAFATGRTSFAATNFATRPAPASGQSAGLGRSFETKSVAVNEDRAATKTALTRSYDGASDVFVPHGRRQDAIDELRRQKNLTIDQVREILNKNR